ERTRGPAPARGLRAPRHDFRYRTDRFGFRCRRRSRPATSSLGRTLQPGQPPAPAARPALSPHRCASFPLPRIATLNLALAGIAVLGRKRVCACAARLVSLRLRITLRCPQSVLRLLLPPGRGCD